MPLATPYTHSTSDLSRLRVAIVHYWFVSRRGGERVVEAIADLFPQADLYFLLYNADALPPSLRKRQIKASFLQSLPGGIKWHRHLLPLYPLAVEQFDLRGYDLVISSESGPAKGVITSTQTCHVCYCHSPMRYLWDMYHDYRSDLKGLKRGSFSLISHYLRMWDLATATRVDRFIANSHHVAKRIEKHYGRQAAVIHPPVDIPDFPSASGPEEFYLTVGQLVAYKRTDLAIEACNRLKRPLYVVGEGEEYKKLRRLAGPTVQFLGRQEDNTVRELYRSCRALLFPGEEDFGIVPVEAQGFGRPVIAYGKGGVLDTVNGLLPGNAFHPGATGVFFQHQSIEDLVQAIQFFEQWESRFLPANIHAHAKSFSAVRFEREMAAFLAESWKDFQRGTGTRAAMAQNAAAR